jgi:hypothetical protein
MERHGDAKLTNLLQEFAAYPKARSASTHDRSRRCTGRCCRKLSGLQEQENGLQQQDSGVPFG